VGTREAVTHTGVIEIVGNNPYVLIPDHVARALRSSWRRPMPVLLQVNGGPDSPWRTNMMPTGTGEFYLYLHGGMRKSARAVVGDTVHLSLRFDDSYRNGPLHSSPDWFEQALAENARAKTSWDALAPSRQKEVLRYFAGLKGDDAKKRNLAQALRVLSGANERFMGRSWVDGK
jgi:Bacteriocin-protection, YdeI or OmpD-Associated/Domain of unknown function (DUF1905)